MDAEGVIAGVCCLICMAALVLGTIAFFKVIGLEDNPNNCQKKEIIVHVTPDELYVGE